MVLQMPAHQRETIDRDITDAEEMGIDTGGIECKLTEEPLWNLFHKLTNEMIVTKLGRRMFPVVKVEFQGMSPQDMYTIVIKFTQIDNHRWKFISGEWCKGGKAEPPPVTPVYIHSESPNFGHHWMKEPVSFAKLKVTNKPSDQGNITLNSLHRYEISVIVLKVEQKTVPISITKFPQCTFIAVTAYQNDLLTELKIKYNPFAKAFLDMGRCNNQDQHNNQCRNQQPTYDNNWYTNELNNIRQRQRLHADSQRSASREHRSPPNDQRSSPIVNQFNPNQPHGYENMFNEWLSVARHIPPTPQYQPQLNQYWNPHQGVFHHQPQQSPDQKVESQENYPINPVDHHLFGNSGGFPKEELNLDSNSYRQGSVTPESYMKETDSMDCLYYHPDHNLTPAPIPDFSQHLNSGYLTEPLPVFERLHSDMAPMSNPPSNVHYQNSPFHNPTEQQQSHETTPPYSFNETSDPRNEQSMEFNPHNIWKQ